MRRLSISIIVLVLCLSRAWADGELKHKDAGVNLSSTEYHATDAHQLNSQATGDMIYASNSTTLSRLPIGTTSQTLLVLNGIPTWASVSTIQNPVTLAGYNYLTLSGQEITAGAVNLASHVTGTLPDANVSDALTVNSSGSVAGGAIKSGTIGLNYLPNILTGKDCSTVGGLAATQLVRQDLSSAQSLAGPLNLPYLRIGDATGGANGQIFLKSSTHTPQITTTYGGTGGGVTSLPAVHAATTEDPSDGWDYESGVIGVGGDAAYCNANQWDAYLFLTSFDFEEIADNVLYVGVEIGIRHKTEAEDTTCYVNLSEGTSAVYFMAWFESQEDYTTTTLGASDNLLGLTQAQCAGLQSGDLGLAIGTYWAGLYLDNVSVKLYYVPYTTPAHWSAGTAANGNFIVSNATDLATAALTFTNSTKAAAFAANVSVTGTVSATTGFKITAGQDIRPTEDSTSAINFAQADGTDFVTFDTSNKRVGIGVTGAAIYGAFHMFAPGTIPGAGWGQFLLTSSDSLAANKGGIINMGGKYTSGGAVADWAAIAGLKTNADTNDYSGYLAFYTRNNGASTAERMRIINTGEVGIGKTPTAGVALDVTGAIKASTTITAGTSLMAGTSYAMIYKGVATVATRPSNPVDGWAYWDSDDNTLYVYNAGTTAWLPAYDVLCPRVFALEVNPSGAFTPRYMGAILNGLFASELEAADELALTSATARTYAIRETQEETSYISAAALTIDGVVYAPSSVGGTVRILNGRYEIHKGEQLELTFPVAPAPGQAVSLSVTGYYEIGDAARGYLGAFRNMQKLTLQRAKSWVAAREADIRADAQAALQAERAARQTDDAALLNQINLLKARVTALESK